MWHKESLEQKRKFMFKTPHINPFILFLLVCFYSLTEVIGRQMSGLKMKIHFQFKIFITSEYH